MDYLSCPLLWVKNKGSQMNVSIGRQSRMIIQSITFEDLSFSTIPIGKLQVLF
jgi:hypothetical protein